MQRRVTAHLFVDRLDSGGELERGPEPALLGRMVPDLDGRAINSQCKNAGMT